MSLPEITELNNLKDYAEKLNWFKKLFVSNALLKSLESYNKKNPTEEQRDAVLKAFFGSTGLLNRIGKALLSGLRTFANSDWAIAHNPKFVDRAVDQPANQPNNSETSSDDKFEVPPHNAPAVPLDHTKKPSGIGKEGYVLSLAMKSVQAARDLVQARHQKAAEVAEKAAKELAEVEAEAEAVEAELKAAKIVAANAINQAKTGRTGHFSRLLGIFSIPGVTTVTNEADKGSSPQPK